MGRFTSLPVCQCVWSSEQKELTNRVSFAEVEVYKIEPLHPPPRERERESVLCQSVSVCDVCVVVNVVTK